MPAIDPDRTLPQLLNDLAVHQDDLRRCQDVAQVQSLRRVIRDEEKRTHQIAVPGRTATAV